jgi:hypothetical protein
MILILTVEKSIDEISKRKYDGFIVEKCNC